MIRHFTTKTKRAALQLVGRQLGPELTDAADGSSRDSDTDGPTDIPDAVFKTYTNMIDLGVSEYSARALIRRVHRSAAENKNLDLDRIHTLLVDQLAADIRIAKPLHSSRKRRHIVAMVGPPGGGKTTNTAKLAARYRLREKRQVGLLAMQSTANKSPHALQSYAHAIDLPLEVVHDPRALVHAVARLPDAELVVVDTTSVEAADHDSLQQLADVLQHLQADSVQLVLNVGQSVRSLTDSIARFAESGATAMMLTHLDHLPRKGRLVELFGKVQLPVSYLATGENLIHDLQTATAHNLAAVLLGEMPKDHARQPTQDADRAGANKVSKRIQLSVGPGR